ncbi:MAG: TraR/DksA family transcriptional regulator [Candidatus Rokubacteria bacterium]|nr:TraR/DksA family transcriptional regulator [Candidatus Rokubacteria bacterium]
MTAGKGQLDADRSSEFRGLLREARHQLLRTVVVTDGELASLSDHEPGSLVEDSARGIMADLLARLEGRERHELDEIQAAQARLETGSFGVCEDCGGAIPLPRLRAVPWARHCLGCQTRDERPRDVRS